LRRLETHVPGSWLQDLHMPQDMRMSQEGSTCASSLLVLSPRKTPSCSTCPLRSYIYSCGVVFVVGSSWTRKSSPCAVTGRVPARSKAISPISQHFTAAIRPFSWTASAKVLIFRALFTRRHRSTVEPSARNFKCSLSASWTQFELFNSVANSFSMAHKIKRVQKHRL